MKKHKFPALVLLILGLFLSTVFLTDCAQKGSDEDSSLFDDVINQAENIEIPAEMITKLLKALPAPVEMTSMIMESGADFQDHFINDNKNYIHYTTSYKKALNLGVYGTDLGYINIYDRFFMAAEYLDVIRVLSDDLNIGQFFDYSVIAQLVSNKSDIDSLMHITTVSFENMTMYLKEQNRSHISALILTGGWIEGLYIFTQTYKFNPGNVELAERICEQKIALNDLIILIEVYESDPQFNALLKDLRKLKEIYDQIEITYTVGEPVVTIVDGALVVEEQTTSTIHYTDEQLKEIIKRTAFVRNNIIETGHIN